MIDHSNKLIHYNQSEKKEEESIAQDVARGLITQHEARKVEANPYFLAHYRAKELEREATTNEAKIVALQYLSTVAQVNSYNANPNGFSTRQLPVKSKEQKKTYWYFRDNVDVLLKVYASCLLDQPYQEDSTNYSTIREFIEKTSCSYIPIAHPNARTFIQEFFPNEKFDIISVDGNHLLLFGWATDKSSYKSVEHGVVEKHIRKSGYLPSLYKMMAVALPKKDELFFDEEKGVDDTEIFHFDKSINTFDDLFKDCRVYRKFRNLPYSNIGKNKWAFNSYLNIHPSAFCYLLEDLAEKTKGNFEISSSIQFIHKLMEFILIHRKNHRKVVGYYQCLMEEISYILAEIKPYLFSDYSQRMQALYGSWLDNCTINFSLFNSGMMASSEIFLAAQQEYPKDLKILAFSNEYYELGKLLSGRKNQNIIINSSYSSFKDAAEDKTEDTAFNLVFVNPYPNVVNTKQELASRDSVDLYDLVDTLAQNGKLAERVIVAVDVTILDHVVNRDLIRQIQRLLPRIKAGKLNVALFKSAAKFNQLGLDKYMAASVVTINDGCSFTAFTQHITDEDCQLQSFERQVMCLMANEHSIRALEAMFNTAMSHARHFSSMDLNYPRKVVHNNIGLKSVTELSNLTGLEPIPSIIKDSRDIISVWGMKPDGCVGLTKLSEEQADKVRNSLGDRFPALGEDAIFIKNSKACELGLPEVFRLSKGHCDTKYDKSNFVVFPDLIEFKYIVIEARVILHYFGVPSRSSFGFMESAYTTIGLLLELIIRVSFGNESINKLTETFSSLSLLLQNDFKGSEAIEMDSEAIDIHFLLINNTLQLISNQEQHGKDMFQCAEILESIRKRNDITDEIAAKIFSNIKMNFFLFHKVRDLGVERENLHHYMCCALQLLIAHHGAKLTKEARQWAQYALTSEQGKSEEEISDECDRYVKNQLRHYKHLILYKGEVKKGEAPNASWCSEDVKLGRLNFYLWSTHWEFDYDITMRKLNALAKEVDNSTIPNKDIVLKAIEEQVNSHAIVESTIDKTDFVSENEKEEKLADTEETLHQTSSSIASAEINTTPQLEESIAASNNIIEQGKKLKEIAMQLAGNIRGQKEGRSTWFSRNIDNKAKKIEAMSGWLQNQEPKSEQELGIALCLLKKLCSIKRNSIGFFEPHSLNEFRNKIIAQGLDNIMGDHVFTDAEIKGIEDADSIKTLAKAKLESVAGIDAKAPTCYTAAHN